MAYFDRFVLFTTLNENICKSIQKIRADRMERFGLHSTDALCIVVLNQHPDGLSLTALATACKLDKAAISRTVRRLCEANVVTYLSKESAKSNYRVPLVLTEYGKSVTKELQAFAADAVEHASEGISPSDLQILYETLEHIRKNLAAYTEKPDDAFKKGNTK